jgi:hypothetical protein
MNYHPPTINSLTAAEGLIVFPYEENGARPEASVHNAAKALACYGVAACSYRVNEETLLDWTKSNATCVIPDIRELDVDSDGWRLGSAGALERLGDEAIGNVKLVPDIGRGGVRCGLGFYINPNINPESMRPEGREMQVRFALLFDEALRNEKLENPYSAIEWLEQFNDPRANKFGTLLDVQYDDPEARPRLTRA